MAIESGSDDNVEIKRISGKWRIQAAPSPLKHGRTKVKSKHQLHSNGSSSESYYEWSFQFQTESDGELGFIVLAIVSSPSLIGFWICQSIYVI